MQGYAAINEQALLFQRIRQRAAGNVVGLIQRRIDGFRIQIGYCRQPIPSFETPLRPRYLPKDDLPLMKTVADIQPVTSLWRRFGDNLSGCAIIYAADHDVSPAKIII